MIGREFFKRLAFVLVGIFLIGLLWGTVSILLGLSEPVTMLGGLLIGGFVGWQTAHWIVDG
jgi:hypothetical protein